MTVTLQKLSDIDYTEVKKFVVFCESSDDVAITSEGENGSVICPVIKKEIKIEYGACRERSCEFHV